MTAFRCTCQRCGAVLRVVGRLTTAALAVLRDHVRQVHPHVGLAADAPSGHALRHFDVEAAP